MKLSEALAQHELELVTSPAGRWIARSVDGPCEVIDDWAVWLAVWWRQSPTSIRECDRCGEVSLAGTGTKKKCYRKPESKKPCGGNLVPLAPKFTRPRPRRKKVKL